MDLVIRFTTSEEDLVIHVADAKSTTPLSVKQRIRQQASNAISGNRLRLISAGRFLPDAVALSKCLTIPLPPSAAAPDLGNLRGKGKEPVPQPRTPRVTINCSVGDALTLAELAAESEAAEEADTALLTGAETTQGLSQRHDGGQRTSTATASEPRGFDRLLSQGFNQAAVAEMRAQYLQILSYSRTPDTMPSGDELRALEDRWLDNNDATNGSGVDGTGAFNGEDGALEDMLWGNIIGFFWPVAMVIWFREDGMWSRRRQISVLTGMLVNLTFGFLRITA